MFLAHIVVCLAPQHFCPPGIYHGALGATVIRTDCWKPAPLLNQKGIILEGPRMGWTPPLGTVQCPYLGKFLGAHPSTFRKLFPAEICFELFVIIFLAISDPDKCWPGCGNVWVTCQVRELGATFERVCDDLISLGLSCFLTQIPLEYKDLWYVGPQS